MEELGKHFFNFFYMGSFFVGIIVLTLNQILILKYKSNTFKKMQVFYLAFFLHTAINFTYFYGLYFGSTWSVINFTLLFVNSSVVLFVVCGINAMEELGNKRISGREKYCIVIFGVVYVLTYGGVKLFFMEDRWVVNEIAGLFFIVANLMFTGVVLWVCIQYTRKCLEIKNKKLFYALSILLQSYVIFNFLIDIFFAMTNINMWIWKINAYNLTVLFYLLFNLAVLLLFYAGEFLQKEKELDIINIKGLTEREKEILVLLCKGKSSSDISKLLFISVNTVKRHLNNIYKKTDVKSRYELISKIKGK